MLGDTYSLRLVVSFLKDNRIPYKYCNANVGFIFHNHGCRINVDDTYSLSIQTHPMVTGESFAETGLTNVVTKAMVEDGTHGYHDVMRFLDPKELFDHILSLNPVRNSAIENDTCSDDATTNEEDT